MGKNSHGEASGRMVSFLEQKKFLKQGALFGRGNDLWLMWGELKTSAKRPPFPAVCTPSFFHGHRYLLEEMVWQSYEFTEKFDFSKWSDLFPKSDSYPLSWDSLPRELFVRQWIFIQELLNGGEIQKAVPYIFVQGRPEAGGGNQIFRHLLGQLTPQPDMYWYGHWGPQGGVLGQTPELLVEKKGQGQYFSMALAGTEPLKGLNEEKFLQDAKQDQEHGWVVSYIQETLNPLGSLTWGPRVLLKTPQLAHLKTSFQLEAPDSVSLEFLVSQMHPTPALGVYPRSQTSRVLSCFNKWCPRGSFGAPFGFSINRDQALFVVAIRSVRWESSGRLHLGAGCGVVQKSKMEREWAEIGMKVGSVQQIFNLERLSP